MQTPVYADKTTITGDGTLKHPLSAVGGGGTSPGGANTDVQYNNAGAFAGDAGLTWDKTNRALRIGDGAGTEGSLLLVNTDGSKVVELFAGNWYIANTPVSSFRPVTPGVNAILDIMPKGATLASPVDSWMDICSTDIELNPTNFECLDLMCKAGAHSHVGSHALGAGVIRPLSLNEDGGNVSVGTSSTFPNQLFVSGDLACTKKFVAGLGTTNVAGANAVLDASTGNTFGVQLTGGNVNISISNPTEAQEILILMLQDGIGSNTATFDASIHGHTAPSAGANTVSIQKFTYNSFFGVWYACAPGVGGM